jgi:hypothetical protein
MTWKRWFGGSSIVDSSGWTQSRRDRLRRLTPADLVAAAQAAVVLPLAAMLLRRYGLRRVQARLVAVTPWRPAQIGSDESLTAARRLAWVVGAVAARGPWRANCLQRSVTLWWLLRRRGLTGDLCIGVRRRPGSPSGSRTLDFHAWVEHQGHVLNDARDVRAQFATFGQPIAPPSARWR